MIESVEQGGKWKHKTQQVISSEVQDNMYEEVAQLNRSTPAVVLTDVKLGGPH